MDHAENQPTISPEANDPDAQYLWLRKQVLSILVLVLVVSGTLNVYLLRQVKFARADLKTFAPVARQIIAEYQQVTGPRMDRFIAELKKHGETHPEIHPLLIKYGVMSTNSAAADAKK